tara:strand:- start:368 stop:550 length:183 start_codon:yes stop_codon:yes gene_type:complete
MDYLDGKVIVKKFCLDDEGDKALYEAVLNNSFCDVIRDEFTYDKAGRAMITVWYRDESDV